MTPRAHYAARIVPALLFSLAALGCQAGSVQLTPVRINLSEAARVAILTVKNTGAEQSVMQVTLNKWTLNGTGYDYKQSQELVITPVTFRLAPGKQQIVRIGLRGKAPVQAELAYRLLVEEVPPPAKQTVTGTRLVVRHDLPVFVTPMDAPKASLDVAVDCTSTGAMLKVSNIGNVHAQLLNVLLEEVPVKAVLGRWDSVDYLLPEASRSWLLAKVAPMSGGKSFVVTALTDQGSFTADVKNSCS